LGKKIKATEIIHLIKILQTSNGKPDEDVMGKDDYEKFQLVKQYIKQFIHINDIVLNDDVQSYNEFKIINNDSNINQTRFNQNNEFVKRERMFSSDPDTSSIEHVTSSIVKQYIEPVYSPNSKSQSSKSKSSSSSHSKTQSRRSKSPSNSE
jgi:hypothetical protein